MNRRPEVALRLPPANGLDPSGIDQKTQGLSLRFFRAQAFYEQTSPPYPMALLPPTHPHAFATMSATPSIQSSEILWESPHAQRSLVLCLRQ